MKRDRDVSDRQSRYPCRIPVRMTAEERRAVGMRACTLHLSISRYLVELATRGHPASPEERARLRYLHALFRDAGSQLRALLSRPYFGAPEGEATALKAHLTETARLLEALGQELGRRLP